MTGYAVILTADLSAVGAAITLRVGVVVWVHRDAIAARTAGWWAPVVRLLPLVGPASTTAALWVLRVVLRPHGRHRREVA